MASGTYKFLLVLHVLSAIIGFGAVFLNGIYGAQARARKGPEGLAISEATFLVSRVAEWFIYGVFVFGILLVLVAEDAQNLEFSQAWLSISIGLYIIGIALSHGLLRPNIRHMIGLQREMASGPPPSGGPPPQLAELERRGQIVGLTSTVLNLLVVVILFLMIWQPGR